MTWAWIKNCKGSEPSLDTKVLCLPQIQTGNEANIMFRLNGRLSHPFLVGIVSPKENGERHRAKVTRQVVEIIDQDNGQRIENINFILDIGNGKVEELISYNQLLEHLENAQDHDMGIDQELYRFRAIIGHQGPLLDSDPDWKRSKYNVQVEWETGEITFEPLSIIAADDPVTCAAYAKENDLLALEGWCRFRSLAKKDKVLARAIKQSKIRQVRRSQTYMFGYLIPRTTWRPCNLTLRTRIANGMIPLS